MVPLATLAAAVLAGVIYVIVPGPATLAALSLSAQSGRAQAARIMAAHFAGDISWTVLALLALAGVSRLGPGLFDALGLGCGLYLLWLGLRALRAPAAEGPAPLVVNPWRSGFAFGLSNPKAYPFALAMLTALLGQGAAGLDLAPATQILAACAIGFVLGDLAVVFWTGLAPIRRLYRRHARVVARALGVLFMLFGLKSIHDAMQSLRGRV